MSTVAPSSASRTGSYIGSSTTEVPIRIFFVLTAIAAAIGISAGE